jgi:hypothetical protein
LRTYAPGIESITLAFVVGASSPIATIVGSFTPNSISSDPTPRTSVGVDPCTMEPSTTHALTLAPSDKFPSDVDVTHLMLSIIVKITWELPISLHMDEELVSLKELRINGNH